jgi:oligopeptide/dipeptide ABC transporter ATP-binding protein
MLDVSIRAEILKLMLDLQKNKNLTYLFITHDLSLAWLIADRIAVFYLGKMVELGPAHEVVRHCRHPYSKALVSVIPTTEEQKGERYVLLGETPSPTRIPEGCRFHVRCWLCQRKGNPELCRTKEPDLMKVGNDHMVSCHFAEDELL